MPQFVVVAFFDPTPLHLFIGELAASLRPNSKTIRSYEAIGLLPSPRRNRSGHRLYGAAERDRRRVIVKAKAIGFTLREIGQLLALRDAGGELCPYLGDLLACMLAAVDAQFRPLDERRGELLARQAEMAVTTCSSTSICSPIERHKPARVR